jgi:hypothetical protein
LDTQVSISITPFSQFTGPAGLHLATGVTISPASLLFDKPATLFANAPLGVPSVVQYYSVTDSGDNLQFSTMIHSGVVNVFNAGSFVGSTHAPKPTQASAGLTAAGRLASASTTTSTRTLSSPPTATFNCTQSTVSYTPSLAGYVLQSENPERAAILSLLGAANTAAITGASTGQYAPAQTTPLVQHLIGSIDQRIESFAQTNAAKPKSLLAAIALGNNMQQIDEFAASETNTALAAALTQWTASIQSEDCQK